MQQNKKCDIIVQDFDVFFLYLINNYDSYIFHSANGKRKPIIHWHIMSETNRD